MMMQTELEKRSADVIGSLESLSAEDALRVLHAVIGRVITHLPDTGMAERPFNPIFIRRELLRDRKGRRSKIEQDPEVRDFIHSLPGNLRFDDIIEKCSERFSAHRVPSRSTLHRYVTQLKYRCGVGEASRYE
jgi:hypothetical protein